MQVSVHIEKRNYQKWTMDQKLLLIQNIREQLINRTKVTLCWVTVSSQIEGKSSRQCYDEWIKIKRDICKILGKTISYQQIIELMQIQTGTDLKQFSAMTNVTEHLIKRCLRELGINIMLCNESYLISPENDSYINILSLASQDNSSFKMSEKSEEKEEIKCLLQQLRNLCGVPVDFS